MDLIKSRPVFKLEDGFIGNVSGVTARRANNVPGDEGSLSIRGLSTLQNTAPLVTVDGIEQSMADIDPNQIKSISALKDGASASTYGSRRADGVIIIETEREFTGDFKVMVNAWAAIQIFVFMSMHKISCPLPNGKITLPTPFFKNEFNH